MVYKHASWIILEGMSATDYSGMALRGVSPVDVKIRDVSITIEKTESAPNRIRSLFHRGTLSDIEAARPTVKLLDNVSADMPHGTLTAIIGASGSGKTTLLNCLARRLETKSVKTRGTILFNNTPDLNERYGYLMQNDCLISTLTVRENLQYGAELRLPEITSREERKAIVEQIILELSLKECADTKIGSSIEKGCSGGEKRRTSLGLQLLRNPSILFVDEGTSGLDSTSAHHMIQTLKELATRGRNIITTIHQPRSEIWSLFDRVIILAHGTCLYSGETKDCLDYFENLGFNIPPFVNPAEYLINLVAIDNRSVQSEDEGLKRFHILKNAWTIYEQPRLLTDHVVNDPVTVTKGRNLQSSLKVSWWRQFTVTTRRSIVISYRDPKGLTGTILEALIVSIILGYTFYNLDDSLQGIRSRHGAFFTAASVQGYLMLVYELHRLTEDVPIFDREYNDEILDVSPFIISRRVAKLLEDIPMCLIYSLIFYFMVGLRSGIDHFLIFFCTVLLIQISVVSISLFSISISREFAISSMITFAVFGLSNFAGGCFQPQNEMPVYVGWLKWASYIFYAYGLLNNNEFKQRDFDCPYPDNNASTGCLSYSGDFQLRALGVSLNVWQQFIALTAIIAIFSIGAGIFFYLVPKRISLSKRPNTNTSESHPKQSTSSPAKILMEKHNQVAIEMNDYSLTVQIRSLKNRFRMYEKIILKPMSISFIPGRLNIVMGTSGSGKTSLLSSLAGRLHNSITAKYVVQGIIMINGVSTSPKRIHPMVSLVAQDDDSLLHALTVRETLRFAAALRLQNMSKEDKHRKADEVLLKMGLKDCADTLIGNDLIKGISGGEKRRVSIAIQLLTNPQILMLDEPTTGLDSSTAHNILTLLNDLAAEGRTVILNIHQSQLDLFNTNCLLLARGGNVIYSGPGHEMLPYFESCGFDCPERTNPGDFVMDLITVDLRTSTSENESRRRVNQLAARWQSIQEMRGTTSEYNKNTISETVSELPSSLTEKATPDKVYRRPSLNRNLSQYTQNSTSITTALPILLHRSILNLYREKDAAIGRIMNVVPYGLLIALFFAPLKANYQSILTRLGMIQLYCFLYFMGTLNNTAIFPLERPTLNRELSERAYSVLSYLGAYTIIEIPFDIISALLTAVVSVFPLGIRDSAIFWAVFFDVFVLVFCGESLALVVGSFVSDVGLTLSITNMLICIAQTMAGVLSVNLPGFLKGINYISPLRYIVGNLSTYILGGVEFDCPPDGSEMGVQCLKTQGDDILKLYDLDRNPKVQLAALVAIVVGYRAFAFTVLFLRNRNWQ